MSKARSEDWYSGWHTGPVVGRVEVTRPDQPSASRSAVQPPSSHRSRSSWPSEVVIDRGLLDVFRRGDDWDGRERGGMLVGEGRPGHALAVYKRFRADIEENSTSRAMELDLDYIDHRRSELPAEQELVGVWHSHGPWSSLDMSRGDVESAASLARGLRREHLVSLIVMRRENARGDLIDVELAAYLVTRDGACHDLAIIEGGY